MSKRKTRVGPKKKPAKKKGAPKPRKKVVPKWARKARELIAMRQRLEADIARANGEVLTLGGRIAQVLEDAGFKSGEEAQKKLNELFPPQAQQPQEEP